MLPLPAKRLLRILGILLAVVSATISAVISVLYFQQDKLVSQLIEQLNQDFHGRIEISGSHISPFRQFPYISVDLENVKIFETKELTSEILVEVADVYVGFSLSDIVNNETEIRKITFDQGFMSLVQHTDGSFNIVNALSPETDEPTTDEEDFHLALSNVELKNIDLLKFNEATGVLVEAFIEDASSGFRTTGDSLEISLKSRFLFNLLLENDTSILHDKHVELDTKLSYHYDNNLLNIRKSSVLIENALFIMEGSVDVDNDMLLDLNFTGNKPNFDLFLAFAPPELLPLLNRYDNGGRIYFDASVKGPSINGYSPFINVNFGCEEAFVQNTTAGKGVNDLFFKGNFTNGEKRDPSTMKLSIQDFSARPETGEFKGNVVVSNFDSPEIDMQVTCNFDLDFLADFLDINNLQDVTGSVSLQMNFHDIIDISQPEKSIEKLNESYFTELKVSDLNFNSTAYDLPVSDVNIHAVMDGHRAVIDQLDLKVGGSDLSVSAVVSDLPAILHHTDIPVEAVLDIKSTLVDLRELTQASDSTGVDERITDLSMKLRLNSSARAITESEFLPVGEFFIEQLNAQFSHYPHKLHDFHADVMINPRDFRVIDFTGMIDESDFHFNGTLEHYDLWFMEKPEGRTVLDFTLDSDLLQLDDLFSYRGENYVPEDYRHEEFRDLKLHGTAALEFKEKLVRSDIKIDRLDAGMKVHDMRFEQFTGRFIIDSTRLEATGLSGRLGNSDFKADLIYHFHSDSLSHTFSLRSKRLDFDQLFAYNPPPVNMTPEDHEAGFNIFELPFSNMKFDMKIGQMNYHRIRIDDFKMSGRMQANHYIFLDSMTLHTAGGKANLSGYFNGSDPAKIYFSPDLTLEAIDLDQLLFKFENFGQDHLVSENLHGQLSGKISGKVHMHADMIPIIDDSEIHMDIAVHNGSLNNYAAFDALSDYFSDKNLNQVRFDTLKNVIDLKDGQISIPAMNINSTLGYFEVSGKQATDLKMEYYLRIPLKVVTKAGFQKLFGKKDQDNTGQVDEIEFRDENKRTRFVNIKIEGTPDEYRISLGKDRATAAGSK